MVTDNKPLMPNMLISTLQPLNRHCWLQISELPYLRMNKNKKLWKKTRHMVTFFRLTWDVPDFILTVAATSNSLRWMCNQVKAAHSLITMFSQRCALLKSFAKLIQPWK